MLSLPVAGALVRDHRAGLGMPRRMKVVAIAMVIGSSALSVVSLRERPLIAGAVGALAVVGVVYIAWRVPTREDVVAGRSKAP